MGMSTYVVGFRPADETWRKMKAIWDLCREAKVPPPAEVKAFFRGGSPENPGMEVDIKAAVSEHHEDATDIYEVALDRLPKDVRYVRFYNSW